MKFLPQVASLIAISGGLSAVPAAAAGIVHQTSLAHEGKTISVSYEARTKTSFRQSGLGPRASAICLWKTEISVERRLTDAGGQPVAALTRVVGEPRIVEGGQPGYCANLDAQRGEAFGAHPERMRSLLNKTADSDAPRLQGELASLGTLGRGVAR